MLYDEGKLKRFQQRTLIMLKAFDAFCKANGLLWFLAGGSTLGAVRHGGFIPWDDDIDIAMSREDFEKLELCMADCQNRLDKYIYSPVEAQLIADAPIGHLYDPEAAGGAIENAPKLDIHPIDGVPPDAKERKKQYYATLIYYLGIYHHPAKNKGAAVRLITRILLLLVPDRIWERIEKRSKERFTSWDVKDSASICSLFGAAGYKKEIMPAEWVFPFRQAVFEGEKFNIPAMPDEYLTRLYGEWRKLPPEDRRRPQHDSYLYTDSFNE